jgi:hypothetical protein
VDPPGDRGLEARTSDQTGLSWPAASDPASPNRVVRFTRFHLRSDETQSLLEARRAWSDDSRRNGHYKGGLFVALAENEWLEITVWDEPSGHPQQPRSGGESGEFVDRITEQATEIVGQETGALLVADAISMFDITQAAPTSQEGRRS